MSDNTSPAAPTARKRAFGTRKIIVAGVALAALAGGVAVASAHRGGGWEHGGWHGKHGGRHGAGGFAFLMNGNLCNGRGAEMADMMAVRMTYALKTTDAQKPALDELTTAMKAGAAKIEAACPQRPERAADGTRQRPTAPERLARLEAGLTARLEAVKTVRPAAEKFYATLNDEQKQQLSAYGDKRRGGWKRDRDRGDDRDDSSNTGTPAPAPTQPPQR